MASFRPLEVFSREIFPGEMIHMITAEGPFRLTMAALDPNEPAQPFEDNPDAPPRATLRIMRHPSLLDSDDDSDEDDDDDISAIERRLAMKLDEDESDESDDEMNGGPSDPAKVGMARLKAATKGLVNGVSDEEDEELGAELLNGVNGISKKGKGKALSSSDLDEDDDDEDDEDDEDEDQGDVEDAVVCTLDTAQHYQQPLDLTVIDLETTSFRVVGTHSIFITGNYIEPVDDEDEDYDDDEDDYDDGLNGLVAPFEEGYDLDGESDDESDELDDLENPRVMELDDEEDADDLDEEVPKLVKADKKTKSNNKRAAESEEDDTLDNLISKTMTPTNGEQKLSKKQAKKLKKNDGQAAAVETKKVEKPAVSQESPSVKKVQFAKNLEQGPTPSPKVDAKKTKAEETSKANGVKTVQGVTIDERKNGSGVAAKKGDRIGMRYIGKLQKDGKVFDSNKKGKPFSFKLGVGEVIKGWDIGVSGMKVGGERRLTIPANQAYGSKSVPGIPSNSTLIFDVKLLSIN